MRRAKDGQGALDFQPATRAETRQYFERYEQIAEVLEANPKVLALAHADIEARLERLNRKRDRRCAYTTENVLRLAICQIIEAASVREIIVRVDSCNFLRLFCGFGHGKMMGHSLFCSLRNAIRPETWKAINQVLAKYAVKEEKISGNDLRIDTTACETNIHYPTDSSLLYDVYRTFARLIKAARKLDPNIAANRRLHLKRAKRHSADIGRSVGKRKKDATRKKAYVALLGLVEQVFVIGEEVAVSLRNGIERSAVGVHALKAMHIISELQDYRELGDRVVDQAKRRVLHGEKVENDEKLFSIFEPHTELLKRGKAGKPIEFGHMVMFAQTEEKFITSYDAYEKKPVEHELVDGVIADHKKLFGARPATLAADKGFYESREKLKQLEKTIDTVAIGKLGKRTPEEDAREHSLAFKLGQAFRAGIEGTISFVKRCLRLARCFNKGWRHYSATIGATVFVHNLLILARGGG